MILFQMFPFWCRLYHSKLQKRLFLNCIHFFAEADKVLITDAETAIPFWLQQRENIKSAQKYNIKIFGECYTVRYAADGSWECILQENTGIPAKYIDVEELPVLMQFNSERLVVSEKSVSN